ncbi:MAG: LmbE-like protein [Patescibacteria group bacterium]|nr:LmbE-like protein [Patescibacteria group bacterium]
MRSLIIGAHCDDPEGMHPALVLGEPGCFALIVTDSGAGTVKGYTPGERLAGLRRRESERGLRELGLPRERQLYPDGFGLAASRFPDGELAGHVPALAELIGQVVERHAIGRIFTAGPKGFDGHPDHQAVHEAAWAAVDAGVAVEVWGLVAELFGPAEGGLWYPSDDQVRRKRFAAMACHQTQFDVRRLAEGEKPREGEFERLGFAIGRRFWEERFAPYWPLIERGEAYSAERYGK